MPKVWQHDTRTDSELPKGMVTRNKTELTKPVVHDTSTDLPEGVVIRHRY